jgi:putative ABC transport system substrate-binding protein
MRRRFLQQLAAIALAGTAAPIRAQGRRFRIYAITWRGKTQVEKGLEDYFARQGIAVEFIWRDAEQQAARLADFVAEIKTMRPDLVYTWGTSPTVGIAGPYDAVDPANHITNIPILFALVTAPIAAKVTPSLTARTRDITGVTHVAALDAQLNAIRTYRPFAKLGVLYNAAERNSVTTAEALRELAAGTGRLRQCGVDGTRLAAGGGGRFVRAAAGRGAQTDGAVDAQRSRMMTPACRCFVFAGGF